MEETFLTDKNFQKEVLKNQMPVIVQFVTDRHGSCHIIDPVMKEMINGLGSQLKFYKINIDQDKKVAKEYSVNDIPTLLFFKKGKVIDRINGVVPKTIIASKLHALLGK